MEITGICDSLEEGDPEISTERLLAMTADSARCDIDDVVEALIQTGRLS
jgi:hypothetical protein